MLFDMWYVALAERVSKVDNARCTNILRSIFFLVSL